MNEFELPSNVKQIGTIGDGLKIYMEDYVITYLKQYAEAGGHNGRQAFLIGKHMVIEAQPYLFISGAIQSKYGEIDDGIETFTEKSFAHAGEQIDQYFEGYEIVGWMLSQPGYGPVINQTHSDFHRSNFTRRHQVVFVMDPVERISCFYVWKDDLNGLKENKGYFIYYEKNAGMQEYMLDNKIVKVVSKRDKGGVRADERDSLLTKEGGKTPRHKTKIENEEYRRVINMLVSLSAVLFIICFIMGAGLIQNDGRINKLEQNLSALDSAYSYLLSSVNKSGTEEVFASQANEENDGLAYGNDDDVDTYLDLNELDSIIENATTEQDIPASVTDDTPVNPNSGETVSDETTSGETASTETTSGETTSGETASTETTSGETASTETTSGETASGNDLPESYVVQQGDSLNFISTMFYGDTSMVDAIMELNDLEDANKIFFGKVLLLPRK